MEQSTKESVLARITSIAQLAQAATLEALAEAPELMPVQLFIGEAYNRQLRYLNGLQGGGMPVGVSDAPAEFGPVTHFWGKEIIRKELVKPADVAVSLTDKEVFLAERDGFYDSFLTLGDTQIFSKASLPGGEAIVRSTAKKAGVKDWQNAAIDVIFIGRIGEHIRAKVDADAALATAAAQVDAVKNTTDLTPYQKGALTKARKLVTELEAGLPDTQADYDNALAALKALPGYTE